MIAIARVVRRLRLREDGVSITELIVAIFIPSIVLTVVGALFVNVVKVTGNSNATTTRSSTAANVMNEISTVIRPAANNAIANSPSDPAIVAGTPLALTIYSLVDTAADNPAPSKVSFSIDAQGNVVESRIVGTLSAGYWVFTGTATTRSLPGPILSLTGTNALFVYLDAANAEVTPGSTGLTLAQRASVVSIKVTVSIANQPTTGTDPITIVNAFGMSNLKIGTSN